MHQATLQQNESQLKNVVRVFAWSQDECDATLYDFTLLPGSRSFEITESILHDLALISEGDATLQLQKYDDAEDLWVGFRVGQVFDAEIHRWHFFFKWREVKHCLGFENLVGHGRMSSLHFRDNLPGEKSYIREALSKKCGLELASNLLPSTPSSLVPSSLTFPSSLATPPPVIKKCRVPSSPTFPSSLAAPPPVVKKRRVPSSLAVPPPVVTKQRSPDIILISSDDENIAPTRNPQLPVPTIPSAKCQKQSLPHSPGVVLVLDSEEENGRGRTRLNIHIKQENLLLIKMEDSDDEASTDDMYMLPL